MPKIEIEDDVFEELKKRARPFIDTTPSDVLRVVMGLDHAPGDGAIRLSPNARRAKIGEIVRSVVAEDPDLEMLEEATTSYLHFAPLAWKLPRLLKGNRKSGMVLSFMVVNRQSLRLSLEIQPGDDQTRRKIFQSVRTEPWFTGGDELSPKWCRVFRKTIISREEYEAHGRDIEWIERRIREKMSEFKRRVFPRIDEVIRGVKLNGD